MKKWSVLVALLFLVACNGMEGETITRCESEAVTTTIEGYNDTIVRWVVHTIRDRADLDRDFSPNDYLSENDYIELFTTYSDRGINGIMVSIVEFNDDYVIIEVAYDYTAISNDELSRLWGVDDFADSITLATAIAGFEESGVECVTIAFDAEENGTSDN